MVLASQPLPLKRLASSGVLCGWMNNTRAELFRLRPHRMELRIGKLLAGDAAADGGAAQALLSSPRVLELLHREVGKLQRERGEAGEAVGVRRAQLRELLVAAP